MKKTLFFFDFSKSKLLGLIFLVSLIFLQNNIFAQTYVNFSRTTQTVAENSYLDLYIEVTGDWDFNETRGFYFYVNKLDESGTHFGKIKKKMYFIDSPNMRISLEVGEDRDTLNKSYKFSLSNLDLQDSTGIIMNAEVDVTVLDIPKAKPLPPRGLFFSGIAGSGEPYNVNAFYLSNTGFYCKFRRYAK
jgi:hypothetical protein